VVVQWVVEILEVAPEKLAEVLDSGRASIETGWPHTETGTAYMGFEMNWPPEHMD